MRLDEIEKRYSTEGEIETVQIADDLGLLTRAVRELAVERRAYQALFEAVDNDHKLIQAQAPEVYDAYAAITETPEPEDDVLELVALP